MTLLSLNPTNGKLTSRFVLCCVLAFACFSGAFLSMSYPALAQRSSFERKKKTNNTFKVGDRIRYQAARTVKKGTVTKILSSISVEVQFDGEPEPTPRPATMLRLINPKGNSTPKKIKSKDAFKPRVRKWSNKEGTKTFYGTFVEKDGVNVTVKQAGGDLKAVPINRLSKADQEYLEKAPNKATASKEAKPQKAFKTTIRKWSNKEGTKTFQGTFLQQDEENVTIKKIDGEMIAVPKNRLSKTDLQYLTEATEKLKDSQEAATPYRVWSDKKGEYKIKAKFLSIDKKVVSLKREDGDEVSIPYAKFNKADQALINSLTPTHPDFGKPIAPTKATVKSARKRVPKYLEVRSGLKWKAVEVTSVLGSAKSPSGVMAKSPPFPPRRYQLKDIRITGSTATFAEDLGFADTLVVGADGIAVPADAPLAVDITGGRSITLSRAEGEAAWKYSPADHESKTASLTKAELTQRKKILLPKSLLNKGRWRSTAFSTSGKAVVGVAQTTRFGRPPTSPPSLAFFDLNRGVVEGVRESVASHPIAISDDGTRVIVLRKGDTLGSPPILHILKWENKDLTTIAVWKMISNDRFQYQNKSISDASFVDNDHFLTRSEGGLLVLWSISQNKALWKLEGHKNSGASSGFCWSPDKKVLVSEIAFSKKGESSKIVFLNPLTGKILSTLPQRLSGIRGMDMNTDGTKLACTTSRQAVLIDLTRGKIVATCPSKSDSRFSRTAPCHLITDDLVLVGESNVLHPSKYVYLWRYQISDKSSKTRTSSKTQTSPKIRTPPRIRIPTRPSMVSKMPATINRLYETNSGFWALRFGKRGASSSFQPIILARDQLIQAASKAKSADRTADFLPPKTTVKIRLQMTASQKIQDEIKQGWIEKIKANGWTYDPQGDVEIFASLAQDGKSVTKKYTFTKPSSPFGSSPFGRPLHGVETDITYRPWKHKMTVTQAGEVLLLNLYTSGTSNYEDGKDIATARKRILESNKPSYSFFKGLTLPKKKILPLNSVPHGTSAFQNKP